MNNLSMVGADVNWRLGSYRIRYIVLLYLLIATPLLVSMAFLIPPGYAPDEPDHAARAESVLHGAILGGRGIGPGPTDVLGVTSGVRADPAIVAADRAHVPGKWLRRGEIRRLFDIEWTGQSQFMKASVAPYFPVFYVPQAAGMGLSRLLGAPPLLAIYAGRLANVLAYLVLGSLALMLAERGAALIFATLLLPLNLWLAASLNQDAALIATACLAAALLTRSMAGQRNARWLAAAGIGCILIAKPPYLPLAALLLLPFSGMTWRIFLQRAPIVAAAVVPALIWSVLVTKYVAAPTPLDPYKPGPLFVGDPDRVFQGTDTAAQMQVLMQPPTNLIVLPVKSFILQLPEKLEQMVGGLGLLDVPLPYPAYLAWLLALATAGAAGAYGRRFRGPVVDPIGIAMTATAMIGCVLLLYVALYLSWTPVGRTRIEGIQGRYFTPLLPFMIFLLPRFGPRPALSRALLAPAVVLAAAGTVYLPLLVVWVFYLR